MSMKSQLAFALVSATASLGLLAAPAVAQETLIGKASFMENCAVCHGADGAGDGPVADLFAQKPGNLKHLAKNNNGVFPFSEVYQAIDGRREIKGHGSTEMPVWGGLFKEDSYAYTVHPGIKAEEIVQGRILALVYYLQGIQE